MPSFADNSRIGSGGYEDGHTVIQIRVGGETLSNLSLRPDCLSTCHPYPVPLCSDSFHCPNDDDHDGSGGDG